jgi:hypothetical protein
MSDLTKQITGKSVEEIIKEGDKKPINIGIHTLGGDVLIQFSREIGYLRMSRSDARKLATRINKVALK